MMRRGPREQTTVFGSQRCCALFRVVLVQGTLLTRRRGVARACVRVTEDDDEEEAKPQTKPNGKRSLAVPSSGLAARDRAHVHARAGPHERAPLDPRGVALELGGVEAVEAACRFGLGWGGRRHTLRSDLFTGCPVSSPSRRHRHPLDRLHA